MVRRLLLIAGLAVGLAGCGYMPSVVKSGYGDFTSYFNSFYNADAAFEEGRRGLEENTQPIDRTVYLSLFPAPEQAGNQQSFEKAIDKSAGILREHPNSRWVDDALLLIGKSYFYLENYVGAEQKFREVMALGEGRSDEARFWLARTLSASGAYDEGIEHLQATLQREQLSKEWGPRLHLALGQLYVRQADWQAAIRELEEGVENTGDRQLKARTHFLLGQLHETTEQYEEAVRHYRQVTEHRPRYELDYAAQVSALYVEGMHGDAERALRALRNMERDDKHYENRGELAYLRGRIEQAQGNVRQAERHYRDVLYHSDANISDVRARLHYALATLYRDTYGDYVAAAAHFDTVTTTMGNAPSGVGETQRTPAAITDAQALSEQFGTFAEVRNRISRMDSLLHLGSLDQEAFRERILEIQRQKAREMAEQRRNQAESRRQQSFQQTGGSQQNEQGGTVAAQAAGEAGFLFHENPIRVQQAKVEFRQRWGERPLVENWRRLSAVSAVADEQAEMPGGVAPDSLEQEGAQAALPSLDISAIPRDEASRERMISQLANARYELGNVLFLQMQHPDSAAAWYRKVITQNGDQPVANRAFYALAEVHRAIGDTASARQLYQKALRRDPDDELTERLHRRLGRDTDPSQTQAARDTLARASAAYAENYANWQEEQFTDAIPGFLTIADRYPRTAVAPKALLAAGQAALQWSRRDSLALTGELPLSLSDSLHRILGLQPPSSDTLMAQEDTLTSVPDTASVAADTLTSTPDTVATDSLGYSPPVADTLTVAAFYEAVADHYPESPQAARAHRVLDAIREKTAPPLSSQPADTTAGTAQDQPPPASEAEEEVPADTTRNGEQQVPEPERRILQKRQQQARDDSTQRPRREPVDQQVQGDKPTPPDSSRTDTTRSRPPEGVQ